ncbi:MinD/ParA family protein [Evansella sp. LMS18]|uniref:MinD/ParA family protein n=1 Tax=Evansella sp. LMS18 TaxID=2924033 RepID=UPI0020D07DF7|nr:MinD/ParA family protein [Evansella sp. LMS18]UTR10848.1 MinD/ParA family protein [Evansella sp. LMS18]
MDQADSLRNRMALQLSDQNKNTSGSAHVIAVASGKGGAGKSNFTVNFSLALQKLGKKVLVFDLDIGMANIDILLGQSAEYTIVDMLKHRLSVWDIITIGHDGLPFVSGGSGLNDLIEFSGDEMEYFLEQLQLIGKEYDYIFFDMPAGLSRTSLHFLLSADQAFLVTTPEPTSVTDGYGMIKFIHNNNKDLPVCLIINRIKNKKEGPATAANISAVCRQFLNKEINSLIFIPDDDTVGKAVRAQTPFIAFSPNARSSAAVSQAARQYTDNFNSQKKYTELSFTAKLRRFFTSKGRNTFG